MSVPDRAPDLPLLLAGLPRAVRDLLRTAGVPTLPLPATVSARGESGRFVLFDSRRGRAAQHGRLSRTPGLCTIDLAESGIPDTDGTLTASQATRVLTFIKEQVESHGGIWLRLGDYPFPCESVLCLAIDHRPEHLEDFSRLKDLFPGAVTHAVSTRLRGDWLTYTALVGAGETAWRVDSGELLDSPRKTRTHWATRRERFVEAGLPVRGLCLVERDLDLPGTTSLAHLGMTYVLRNCGTQSGTVRCDAELLNLGTVNLESLAAIAQPVTTTRFVAEIPTDASTLVVPPSHYANSIVDPAEGELPAAVAALVRQHYAGRPVFVHDNIRRQEVTAQYLLLRGAALRLSLMWQATFGDFAQWWALRQQVELQVWQTDAGCTIRATGDLETVPRSLEIWRGAHRAVLPLTQSTLSVRDDGVAYVYTPHRSPAGLAGLPEPTPPGTPETRITPPAVAHDSWAA